ncbi:MAG TPA: D-alanyl-D-alanine carboxypeptidase [Candidatus Dormibacteraeota bacterium]|nr:D-alanyl-D-alanine carboxypeptidase [Candidatus Dormibacteraeota bacterium]
MRWRVGAGLLAILVALAVWNYLRPIPAVTASAALPSTYTVPGTAPSLPWPTIGSAAVGVSGIGFIATSGNEKSLPAASVTKVMTALIVLEDKPLKRGEPGPVLTMTDTDVQGYQSDFAQKQSVVEVRAGEQLTEYQVLQGMLIPSANNLAETIARWDAGSIQAFVSKMNDRATRMHLTHTKFADTSGADPGSVSTPTDLVTLGMAAMRQEVFAEIVGLGSADLPVAGTVYNVDAALGHDGVVGIKTGSGFDLGANFLFAANVTVDGRPIVIYGCVMGEPTLALAFSRARTLITAMQPLLHVRRVISRNETIATYSTPWGPQSDLISTVDVDLAEWPGMVLRQSLSANALVVDHPINSSTQEGVEHVVLGDYSVDAPLVTADPLYPPGRFWRLTRVSF